MRATRGQVPLLEKGIRRIRLLFETWYPWNQKLIASRLQPVHIRKLTNDDIPWCEELYNRNDRYGVPKENYGDFQRYLRSNHQLVLIVEDGHGNRVGTFGLSWVNESVAVLTYLLIEPPGHAKGYGTTAVIAAISLLAKGAGDKILGIYALPHAIPFYRKFGFRVLDDDHSSGFRLFIAVIEDISPLLIIDCVEMLSNAGVTLPDYSDEIPLTPVPSQDTPAVDNSIPIS